jgi:hypothetical protein
MSKGRLVRILGTFGLLLSLALAGATVWAFSAYRQSIGQVSRSLSETVVAASDAIVALAQTTKERSNLAEDSIGTLRSVRATLQKAKEGAEHQVKQLPHHESALRKMAANVKSFADMARKTGDALLREVPIIHRPLFERPGQAFLSLAETGEGVTASLTEMADSVKADAVPLARSAAESMSSALTVVEHAEKGVVVVKDDHLPRAIATMEQAAAALKQAGAQLDQASYFPVALLLIGLSMAACCALVSAALVILGGTIDRSPGSGSPLVTQGELR